MAAFIPIAMLAAKAGKAYFGAKAKKKQNDEQRKAEIAKLAVEQKQKEDARRARVKLGGSMLNSVPGTTAGGGVNTNVGIDPTLLEQLGAERNYDFGSTVPNQNAGSGSAFLAGLFGGAGDTLAGMRGSGQSGGGDMSSMLYNRTQAFNDPGAGHNGGMPTSAAMHDVGGGAGGQTVTMEDLMKLYGIGG